MRKTKKLLALILCASMTVTAFTGCGKKDADTDKKSASEELKETEPLIADAASYIELAEYKTIELEKKEIDEKLQSQIDGVLESNVSYKEIKSGKVKKGDTVNIYYVGKMDGKAFDGGSCTKETTPDGYDLEIGSGAFIDGFEDALIGKIIGDTVDINVTFPKDYTSEELAGKPAVFTVTLNYKRGKKITPEFDDAFVKKNLSEYKSVKDYKKKTRESIIKSMAMEKVCSDTKVNKYPKDKVSAMKTQMKKSIENYLSQSNTTLEDYLAGQNMTEEDYAKQLEKTSKEDVGNQLVYNAVAQAENIEITDDEYQKELKTYLENYGCKKESELNKTFSQNYGTTIKTVIYNSLLYSKIADYLVKNVKEV